MKSAEMYPDICADPAAERLIQRLDYDFSKHDKAPRRWLLCCNQELAQLIGEKIGMDWATDLDKLRALAAFADDPDFRQRWRGIKRLNKEKLAAIIKKRCNGLEVDPASLFDIQVKRIHQYKRQLLNVLVPLGAFAMSLACLRLPRGLPPWSVCCDI